MRNLLMTRIKLLSCKTVAEKKSELMYDVHSAAVWHEEFCCEFRFDSSMSHQEIKETYFRHKVNCSFTKLAQCDKPLMQIIEETFICL